MVLAYANRPYDKTAVISTKCGCDFSNEESKKWRVKHKIHFFLPDGRELVRVTPIDKPMWEIKDGE